MIEQYSEAGNIYECREQCGRPCEEVSNHAEMSMVPWPGFKNRVAFYNEFIKGQSFEDKFRNFSERIEEKPIRNNSLDFLALQRVITEAFLQVTIKLKDQEIVMQTQVPKLDFVSLWSQMGGALNLYAGITFVVLVELIEMIYYVFNRPRHRGTSPNIECPGYSKG